MVGLTRYISALTFPNCVDTIRESGMRTPSNGSACSPAHCPVTSSRVTSLSQHSSVGAFALTHTARFFFGHGVTLGRSPAARECWDCCSKQAQSTESCVGNDVAGSNCGGVGSYNESAAKFAGIRIGFE